MPRQKLRLVETRRPDVPDDHKTPEQIQQADIVSEQLEHYTQYIISQIRQILGTTHWTDPVPASLARILELLAEAQALANWRMGVELLGIKNHTNLVFTTPERFAPNHISVYFNGQKLKVGVGNDYVVAEGGGYGSGWDTVVLLDPRLAPYAEESVCADYVVATT